MLEPVRVPRMESGSGAYGRYPLTLRIPHAEMNGNTPGFRHMEYVIELDDCGKLYTRRRRYTLFAWLHAELRRRELACALPELPPKKLLGNCDQVFVERRKQLLEEYLKALLLIPAVIQDGTIWAFLDADEATAVVPRFLCRQSSVTATEKTLTALKRAVAEKEEEVFRLCDSTVLEELAKFARQEATEEMLPTQMQVRFKNRAKLCFILYKVINYRHAQPKLVQSDVFGALLALLSRATKDEAEAEMAELAAREHNCFWASKCVKSLIQETNGEALLYFCQQEGAVCTLRELAQSEFESLHALCAWVLWFGLHCNNVVTVLAVSDGLRLQGDLVQSPDLCARILGKLCLGWIVRQGVLDEDSIHYVLQALAPLPKLLDNAEVIAMRKALDAGAKDKSTVAQTKCIQHDEFWDYDLMNFLDGRSFTSFDVFDKHGCKLQMLTHMPDAKQFPLRLVVREDGPASASEAVPPRRDFSAERRSLAGSLTAETMEVATSPELPRDGLGSTLEQTRDHSLVKTLAEICAVKELPRLQVLLGDEGGELDTVTACIVAILDHFVLQCEEKVLDLEDGERNDRNRSPERPSLDRMKSAMAWAVGKKRGSKDLRREVSFQPRAREENTKLQELQPLIGHLERLVKGHWEGTTAVLGGAGGAAADQRPNTEVSVQEVQARTARILVRLKAFCEASAQPLPHAPLEDFGPRKCILEVLVRDAHKCQMDALDKVAKTKERCEHERFRIKEGGLSEDPCVRENDLQGFKQKLRDLTKSRGTLRYEMDNLTNDLEAMEARLQELREIKHSLLATDVSQLVYDLRQKEDEFMGCQSVLCELEQCEKQHQQSLAKVEELRAHLRDAEVKAENFSKKEAEARAQVEDLRTKETYWEEYLHTAPAKLQECKDRLMKMSADSNNLAKQRQEISTEVDRKERRIKELKECLKEASAALEPIRSLGKELEAWHPDLHSEIIMTDTQVLRLKQFAAKLAPAKPSRLRRRTGTEEDVGRESEPSSAREACNEGAPRWDDSAEQEFHEHLHFRALRKLRDEKERCWLDEERWLNETLKRTEEDVLELRKQFKNVEAQEKQMHAEEDELKKQKKNLSDSEVHQGRLEHARAASACACKEHEDLRTQYAQAAGDKEMIQQQLKQAQEEASEVLGPQLQEAQHRASLNEQETKKARQDMHERFQKLEKRAREFLQEWRSLEKKEQGLDLREGRVKSGMESEKNGRQALREEVKQLMEMLRKLDDQLKIHTEEDSS